MDCFMMILIINDKYYKTILTNHPTKARFKTWHQLNLTESNSKIDSEDNLTKCIVEYLKNKTTNPDERVYRIT